MNGRYHVNPESGLASACSSDPTNPRARGCAFKLSDDEHYGSAEEARAAFEAQNSDDTFTKSRKSSALSNTPWGSVKLSADAQEAIAKELARQKRAIARASRITDAPGSLNEVLTPPVYAIRDRGVYVVTRGEDEDLAYYSGDEEGPFLVISSRQGGGNNEYCYDCDEGVEEEHGCLIANNEEMESHPQFVYAADDSFDSTYRYAYFTFDEERYENYLAAERLRNTAKVAEDFQSNLKEGKVTPWGFNGDYSARLREFEEAQSAEVEARQEAEKIKRDNELLVSVTEKFENVEELSDEEIDFAEKMFYNRSKHWIPQNTITKDYKELLEKKRELQYRRTLVAQAETLPEGSELREHLLKDRGQGSYNTTKKVGRRNQTVKVTYERGSLLGSDAESAERSYERAHERFQKGSQAQFSEQAATNVKPPVNFEELEKKVSSARKALWREGWDESWGKPPAMPRDFFAS